MNGEPRVINRYHYASVEHPDLPALPDGAINVMRGTPLGNPYERAYLTRWAGSTPEIQARVKADPFYMLEPYRRHLFKKIEERDEGVIRALAMISSSSLLTCCCVRPDGSGVCHAHLIARAFRWWHEQGCPGLRIGIVGSKSWPAFDGDQYIEINTMLIQLPRQARILTRNVEGVDRYAHKKALHFGLEAEVIEVDRERDGKGAEFKRDRRLVESAHWVYGFWRGQSRGTQHVITCAEELGRYTDFLWRP